ncbi:MAG: GldG family protein [Deltaproteobacteria bacterium]|nr:GldG family protein [Deltaproteobacteria bacterium]
MSKSTPKRSLGRFEPAQLSQLVGVVAAMAVVVLLNVVASRRYTRWDWTSNKRYTLSPATVQTLRDLPDTVQIWVLAGAADPIEQSVKQLLVAYQAETTKLDVHYVDPDRDTIALEDVRKRFKIETGRTDNGHVVADAVVVVARGEKHWFITNAEMVEVGSDDTRVKPREERALTGAIRNVLGGDRTKICFTKGHGEMSPLDVGEQGAGMLKDLLEKDNYESVVVDAAAPNAPEPFKGCGVVVVAGLRGTLTNDETERLRTWLLADGNLLLAASPIPGDTDTGLVPAGLDRVVGPFGIGLDEDLVVEQDEQVSFPNGGGLRFAAQVRPHAITTALVKGDSAHDKEVPRVVVHFARSLKRAGDPGGGGSASPVDLLASSDKAFGLTSVVGAADWKDRPVKRPGDLAGPLVLAMASERPKASPSSAHGARVVVLGTASLLTSPTFREPLPLRGGAFFVESAISWLASKPQVLDVPDKAAVAAGLRIDDESRATIRRYVLVFMPATVGLLGVAIALFRRQSEGKPKKKGDPEPPAGKGEGKKKRGKKT